MIQRNSVSKGQNVAGPGATHPESKFSERQQDCSKFKASLAYIVNSRTAKAMEILSQSKQTLCAVCVCVEYAGESPPQKQTYSKIYLLYS